MTSLAARALESTKVRYAAPALALSIYACLALYGANAEYLDITQMLRSLAASALLAWGLVLLSMLIGIRGRGSGLIAAVLLLAFFSYGHLYQAIEGARLGSILLGRHRYLLLVVLGGAGVLTAAIVRTEQPLTIPFRLASTVGAVAVTLSLVAPFGRYLLARALLAAADSDGAWQGAPTFVAMKEDLPDIYYIMLDGYGRADVLDRLYQLDNSEFLTALEDMGFYVADEASANYIQTRLSLAAALNMDYLDDLVAGVPPALAEARVDQSLQDSRLWASLEDHGYQLVSFESGFPYTEFDQADLYLTPDEDPRFGSQVANKLGINSYEAVLLNTTLLRAPIEWAQRNRLRAAAQVYSRPHQDHRVRIRYALSKLPDLARLEGRHFVFVHILAPHPPFVFTADGEAKTPVRPYSLSDGSSFMVEGTRTEYINGYRQQVLYLNSVLEATLRTVIDASEPPPVIILQSDHGPGAYLDWGSSKETDLEERASILNAVYLQGEQSVDLYSGLSTVNTFRVVFNWLFDPDQPLLVDRSFYSSNTDPFNWVELERTDQERAP